MRYIPSITKNIISVGALKDEGPRGTLGEGVLKMSSGSLALLKGIRRDVYLLMGSAITGLTSSKQLSDNSTRLWHEGLK